jgi:hypothetical protein
MILKTIQIKVLMKKSVYNLLIFTLLFVVSNGSLFAKIWRVNNAPGINADFNNLQTAHNSASAGDTIYIEGTPFSYGGLTCTKRLSLFGPGFFLGENENTLAIKNHAHVDGITFNEGSQGSLLYGLYLAQSLNCNVNNIHVKRNWLSGFTLGYNKDSILISGNYFQGYLTIYQDAPVIKNIRILNNIINGINLSNSKSVLIINNYLSGCISGTESFFTNNIINQNFGCGGGSISDVSKQNLFSNNIFKTNGVGSVNGNQANVDLSTVFLVEPSATKPQDVSTDGRWQLKVGSPAKAAGFGSTNEKPVDIGPFGGTDPYVLSGLPPIPSIYFFEHQPIGSNADPLDVRIKVISRN